MNSAAVRLNWRSKTRANILPVPAAECFRNERTHRPSGALDPAMNAIDALSSHVEPDEKAKHSGGYPSSEYNDNIDAIRTRSRFGHHTHPPTLRKPVRRRRGASTALLGTLCFHWDDGRTARRASNSDRSLTDLVGATSVGVQMGMESPDTRPSWADDSCWDGAAKLRHGGSVV